MLCIALWASTGQLNEKPHFPTLKHMVSLFLIQLQFEMAHSIDHEEIGKLLTPSISQLGGIQQRITTPPQRRHSDIPTG